MEWSSALSTKGFPRIKKVISDRKTIFLVCADTVMVRYKTESYVGDTYPLPLVWGKRHRMNKEYSVSDYPPLEKSLKKHDEKEGYYGYQIIHKGETFSFYLLKSTVEGSEFDEPCYHLVVITQNGKFHKIAIPTERANVFIDKQLNITLTYDPMDDKSYESYAKSKEMSSVFVEKYKIDSSSGEIKLADKQRKLLNEKEITPDEFERRLMNNLNDKIQGMEEALFASDSSSISILCYDKLKGVEKALAGWVEKRLNNTPYTIIFSPLKIDIPGLQFILVNPYQGGDFDDDYGLIVSKDDVIISYIDLQWGGYLSASYTYEIHPDGLIETGTDIYNPKSANGERPFRLRDKWQIGEDGTIRKVK